MYNMYVHFMCTQECTYYISYMANRPISSDIKWLDEQTV